MPELPEVETVCRVMRRALEGRRIVRVEVVEDPIVFSGVPVREIEKALRDRVVDHVGRRGKTFWVALRGPGPTLFGHLGMSGWIREVGRPGARLHSHGEAPLDDPRGRPRFLRLWIEADEGHAVAFTDPRRLGRIWLGESPETEPRVRRLGPDAYDALPSVDALRSLFATRKRAVKAVLLDQHVLAGIGNWIADEVLYQARIAPARVAASLSRAEVVALRAAIRRVLERAVTVSADHERFPKSWLFEHRWGGHRGADEIAGQRIRRDVVGGRTTAWVPARQK
jgi:formamidopyrimidine-DNA glycosylase